MMPGTMKAEADGTFSVEVKDGDDVYTVRGRNPTELTYEVQRLHRRLEKNHAKCRLCGARRDKCCC